MFKLSRSERTVPPHKKTLLRNATTDFGKQKYSSLRQAMPTTMEGAAAWRGGGWGGGLIKR